MAITFNVAKNRFSCDLSDAALATAVKEWLDGLDAATVYSVQMQYHDTEWHIICIYVEAE
jgi:hypothetical protein